MQTFTTQTGLLHIDDLNLPIRINDVSQLVHLHVLKPSTAIPRILSIECKQILHTSGVAISKFPYMTHVESVFEMCTGITGK